MFEIYFATEIELSNLTLHPRVPMNFLISNGYEDATTPRICVSDTVDKCLIALSQNLKNKELFIYEAEDENFINPGIVKVPDCEITGEMWFCEPVTFKFKGKIKVENALDSFQYTYGNKTSELYSWYWDWI